VTEQKGEQDSFWAGTAEGVSDVKVIAGRGGAGGSQIGGWAETGSNRDCPSEINLVQRVKQKYNTIERKKKDEDAPDR
jgi:hypothetical protein